MIFPVIKLLPSVFLVAACVGSSLADQLPDGFVERAVQIVIRDDVATISYSIGLNESTMRQVLDDWNDEPQSEFCQMALSTETSNGSSTADEFRLGLTERLSQLLRVTIDGQPMTLQLLSLEPSSRHHYSFEASLEFHLPASKSQKLSVVDGNFRNLNGAARYALKTAGSTIIFNSNVAPIIVRAARHDLSWLDPAKREEICTIYATIASVPNQSARR